MEQIEDWLEKLSLAEDAERFTEKGIGLAGLRHLTDQDLKEVGVLLGHRRIMLAAIAELAGAAESVAHPVVGSEARSPDGAERRQVTVMFSDLVGSTALSARMAPEDLREVISAYQKCVAETVQRFGGFVAKYMGDGVLIYFGYPQAHEDDAERAVRAGLAVIEAVGRLPARQHLNVRLGIATGLAVGGDLIGEGAAQERGVVGETPNLAAPLQGLSLPNPAADLNLSPQRKREKLFEALLNQLEAEARRRPVLMVFEDAHWIDPSSRELLDFAVDRGRHLPVLLAITFRPEFQPPWSGRAHVTSLALNRLGEP